eukprot:m.273485 g.273485  ORF g.273485 m.273485 type:complete len:56 (+) comp107129_c0_seq1:207-374(+)
MNQTKHPHADVFENRQLIEKGELKNSAKIKIPTKIKIKKSAQIKIFDKLLVTLAR